MNVLKTNFFHSRQFTESILKSMHEGLLVLNETNTIEIVNEAALKLFGFSKRNDLCGKYFGELYKDDAGSDNFIAVLELDEGRLRNLEDIFIKANSTYFTGLYSAAVVRDLETSILTKVICIQDITERKKSSKKLAEYTRRLEKNNKELDQFAYIVSHDLKAPLRAISNLSIWLLEDLGPNLPDANRSSLEMLKARVQRLESLINGVLEYSKLGRASTTSETLNTFGLLTEVLEMLSPPSHIKVEISPEMPDLEGPRTMLFQVFSNLISNSIKYNDKKEGLIKISVIDRENCYEFTIEDNGPGIPPEYHEKVFVIFQTLQSRDKFESTGIGLTIVKRIIEDRRGRIWIESESGKGCKFIFTWPKTLENNEQHV